MKLLVLIIDWETMKIRHATARNAGSYAISKITNLDILQHNEVNHREV